MYDINAAICGGMEGCYKCVCVCVSLCILGPTCRQILTPLCCVFGLLKIAAFVHQGTVCAIDSLSD